MIARIFGKTRALLKGERTALNLLQHMSGIASMTNRCVKLVEGTNAGITDTAKRFRDCARCKNTRLSAEAEKTTATI